MLSFNLSRNAFVRVFSEQLVFDTQVEGQDMTGQDCFHGQGRHMHKIKKRGKKDIALKHVWIFSCDI